MPPARHRLTLVVVLAALFGTYAAARPQPPGSSNARTRAEIIRELEAAFHRVEAVGSAAAQATITVNPAEQYQVMHRWESVAAGGPALWAGFTTAQLAEATEIAVNDLNFTRARIEIANGAEGSSVASNPARYTPINDNADPNVLDLSRFDFSFLDTGLDKIVVPLRAAAARSGKTIYLDLRYVDHIANTPFEHWQNPAEYGEFMLAVFTHMRDRFGFVPDSINVVNEPDNFADYTGQGDKIGRMIVAAATRLQSAGFGVPQFAAPSVTAMGNLPGLFDQIASVPGALQYLTEISYHRYNSSGNPADIVSRALAHGKRTAMLEFWSQNGNSQLLHQDLTEVRASAWEQSQVIDGAPACQFNQMLFLNNGAVDYCPNTKLIRQYTRHVNPGARRIGASGTGTVQPVAFINTDGTYVVVVKGSGSFTVSGLPAGVYGRFYSTGSAFNVPLPDVAIAAGELVAGALPADGVLTIYGKAAGPQPPPPPPTDSDGDGVPDNQDQCPGTPPGSAVNETGCVVAPPTSPPPPTEPPPPPPEPPAPPPDSDGDGVTDSLDQCPGTPSGTPVNSATGCEVASSPPPPPSEPAPPPPPPTEPPPPVAVLQSGTVTINPSIRHQVMHRWEGVAAGGPVTYAGITEAQMAQAAQIAVNDLNYTRARIEIASGAEGNSVAANPGRYMPVNDNGDPNVLNLAAFDFSFLDHSIDRVVIPLRQAAAAAGKTFYLNLLYVDHIANTPFEHWHNPAEYGEFMLAVFTHMRDKYGFVPDSIDTVNEPDNFADYAGQGDKIGRMIVAAATRLQAAGFSLPAFAAPSVTAMGNLPGLFDQIASVPGALSFLTEVSYHRYNSSGDPNDILSRALAHGKRTSMLEKWDGDGNYALLHRDLTEVWVSSWQQSQFMDVAVCQFNQILFLNNGVVDYCPNTRLIRQYTKYVNPGAQRIGAVGTGAVQPVAFINTDGTYVVVVKGSGPFTVSGLPPGVYGQFYSTASTFNVQLPDVLVTSGGLLSANLPEDGALTIHGRAAAAPPPPPPPTSPPPPIGCPLPDPFAVLGGGTCVGGNWLPPGYPGGSAAPPPPSSPPPETPTIPCIGPDPFVSLGGGICFNGEWLPPGYPIPQPPATTPPPTSIPPPSSSPPPSATGCTTPDPFVSLGGGVCLNGNWLPPSYPGTQSPTEPPPPPATSTPGGCPGSDPFASLITLIGRCVNGDWLPVPAIKTNGTVGFFEIGAGLWAIVGPDGTVYEPVGGLESGLRIQGLSVHVEAELTAGTSAYPTGVLVTIHSIVPNLPAP